MKKLYIKNMVCNRCKMVVNSELQKLGIYPLSVVLGEIELDRELSDVEKQKIEDRLTPLGFLLIDDKKSRLIEQIKTVIVELVHYNNIDLKINLSDFLKDKVYYDYNYISHLFSEIEGTTIEKYFIAQKIERVKELLAYDELSISQIAFQLNYSSVAHLSNQFKKVTGLNPTYFKNIKPYKRNSLDEV